MKGTSHTSNRRRQRPGSLWLTWLLAVLLTGTGLPVGNPLVGLALAQSAPRVPTLRAEFSNQAGTNSGPGRLVLTGDPEKSYLIQASTNLAMWVTFATNRTAGDGTVSFTDSSAGQFTRRFYRAVSLDDAATTSTSHRTDRVLVKPKPGVALSVPNLLLGATVTQTFARIGRLQVVQLPAGQSVSNALAVLRQSNQVEYAEPDYIVRSLAEPNDFRFFDGTLWNLKNTGQLGGKPRADIDAPAGWDIKTTATDIIIAVIDTGVRYTHEDLAGSMWTNPDEIAGNGRDDDGNGVVDDVHGLNAVTGSGNPFDDHGHGSHVSGIIGGVGDNSVGVAGVCWRARIMALKSLDAEGNGAISDAIRCLDYARSQGARIINASWGTTGFNSAALRDAIISTRDADIIFVAAAGNSAEDNSVNPIYPASYDVDNIISVAATTRTDDLAPFSNYGATTVHLAAPGSPIFSCWGNADDAYQYLDGTSMAAPHVAGAAALCRSLFPGESYRQIINRVLAGVDPLPGLAGKCTTGGRLNLPKTLGGAPPPPPAPTVAVTATDATASEAGPDAGTFTITRSGSTSAALTVNYSVGGTASNGADFQTLPGAVTIPAGAASTAVTVTPVDDASVEGSETVIVTLAANSPYSVGSPGSATVTISDNDQPPPPEKPTVTVAATDASATEGGGTGAFTVSRTGGTSAALTVSYSLGGSASNGGDYQSLPSSLTIPVGASSATITVTPIDDSSVEGSETVVLTLASSSAYDLGSPSSATVTISDNDQPPPPPSANFTANPTSGNAPLGVQFTDQSTGSISTWDWNFGDGTPRSSARNPFHTYNSAGTFTATLTVTGPGGSNNRSTTITVSSPPPPTPPTVTVTASDANASEAGPDPGTFTISRSGSTSAALTVNYSLGGTAGNGGDYQSLPSSVTIPVGASSVTGIVRPNDDPANEGSESVVLTLSSSSAYNLGSPSTATIIITDNDQTPDVRPYVTAIATKPAASESGENGVITISRSTIGVTALTVFYTLGGNAQNGVDYQRLSGSVTIPAGTSSATVTIVPINDADVEIDEPLYLMLAPGAGYLVGKPDGAAITIQDNDQPPVRATVTASATDPNASESGDTGTITVYRAGGGTANPLTVFYTLGGNAQNGVDYQRLSGSVSIPAGASSATVTIVPIADSDAEINEPVYLMLAPGTGYIIGTPNGAAVTIANRP